MASYDTGWLSLATATDEGGFAISWANVGNSLTSDDAYAGATITGGKFISTNWLVATELVAHGIPADAVITGIGVKVEGHRDSGGPAFAIRVPWVGGSVGPASVPGSEPLNETTDDSFEYGSAGNLSELSLDGLTRADVVGSGFGFAIRAFNVGFYDVDVSIDHIQAKIFYDSDTGPGGGGGSAGARRRRLLLSRAA